jgi:predicted dehydrogenase
MHPALSVFIVSRRQSPSAAPLKAYLGGMGHVHLEAAESFPRDLQGVDVVVTADACDTQADHRLLTGFVERGGGWLKLVDETEGSLPEGFGVRPGKPGDQSELRIVFQDAADPLAVRLPEAFYLAARHRPIEIESPEAQTVLYADWHYTHSPVVVRRTLGKGRLACATIPTCGPEPLQQVFYRLIRFLAAGPTENRRLGVGILGYAPWVGKIHGLGAQHTVGMELRITCDLNPRRLQAAAEDFPGVKTCSTAEALAGDPDIDLVVIATPPDSHARLALQMTAAGKHVVVEKPLALSRREAESMAEAAQQCNLHLSCHQNRRWDVDYLAIRQALTENRIGGLFHMETFVGGFEHPCGYWHSHAPVSGGTAYDWGGHYLDWIVSLMPGPIASVTGSRHKRVWHDVTNADQETIRIRFADGRQAEFMHSDIAAVRKPKWYLLGTEGAIVGHWREVSAFEIDPVLYYHRHEVPPTEMTPDLRLFRRHPTGRILEQALALPERRFFEFHRNLADHLLTGEPLAAPLEDSVRVVAILEAAARSAASGGRREGIDD